MKTSWLVHGLLFADPHAGNWIFHRDGRVTVLDFGCVVPFAEADRASLRRILGSIERGDDDAARGDLRVLVHAPAGRAGDLLAESMRIALAPLALDRPARPDDLERIVRLSGEAKRQLLGKRLTLPPWMPLLLRALLGTTALLAALEARCA